MIYSVFTQNEDKVATLETLANARFIKHKKSIWALIFPAFWLIYNALWWEFLAYIIYLILPTYVAIQGGEVSSLLLSYLPGLFLFLEGSTLKHAHFERKGWALKAILNAENQRDAEFKFFMQARQQAPQEKPTKPTISIENKSPLRQEIKQRKTPALTPTFGVFE